MEYIGELRAIGAYPVLVTPLARNSWRRPGQYNDLLEAYAHAVIRLGEDLGVPVIDLHGYTMKEIRAAGLDGAKPWFFPSDYTHTNDYDAYKMAPFVGRELGLTWDRKRRYGRTGNLIGPFTVPKPPKDCSLTPPPGMEDRAWAFEEERPEDGLKRIEGLELIIEKLRFRGIINFLKAFQFYD